MGFFQEVFYLSKKHELLQESQGSKTTKNHSAYKTSCLYPVTISTRKLPFWFFNLDYARDASLQFLVSCFLSESLLK